MLVLMLVFVLVQSLHLTRVHCSDVVLTDVAGCGGVLELLQLHDAVRRVRRLVPSEMLRVNQGAGT
jgi:hypothetical protein